MTRRSREAPARQMRTMDPVRILADLKPALDGYAGIPQETRLLFRHLQGLQGVACTGLLQHGGRLLCPALPPKASPAAAADRLFRLSSFVISLSEHRKPRSANLRQLLDRRFALDRLEWHTRFGRSVPHTVFDAGQFGDFVWRTLFEKTLPPSDMEVVSRGEFMVVEAPRHHFHQVGLRSLKRRPVAHYPLLDTRGYDLFLAQTPFPGRVSPGTQLVVRYHDAVPVLMPHTIADKALHHATHFHALRANVEAGAHFSCVSEATRQDLLKLFPEAEPRTFVIHNMVGAEYHAGERWPAQLVPHILQTRLAEDEDPAALPVPTDAGAGLEYLLMVSTLEPRKNHPLLLRAWERLRQSARPHLKLVLVGNPGWDYEELLRLFRPWRRRGELVLLRNVPPAELRTLYQHAAATVCPSLAEGFDYSGVEAMGSGCPVVASDIPVHREVYRHAAAYFNPYDAEQAAQAIESLLAAGPGAREALVGAGHEVARCYLPEQILPQWSAYLERTTEDTRRTADGH